MIKLQNLSKNIILENKDGQIYIFSQSPSPKYHYQVELDQLQNQQIDLSSQYFLDITQQKSEFQKIISQILKSLQNILSSQLKFINIIQNKKSIDNCHSLETSDQALGQKELENLSLKHSEDLKRVEDMTDLGIQQMSNEYYEENLSAVISNYLDLQIFLLESKCGDKINAINPFCLDINSYRVIKIGDLTLQIIINEYCNKKYDLNCELLNKLQDLIQQNEVPYISVRSLNLQLTSYFNHFDFRKCEISCYYDEENPTKFYLDLGKIQAENIYSTLDLEQDNRIYIKIFFSSDDFLCKVTNLIETDYFQIFFRDQNNQYLSHIQYSSVFDDRVYFYLTNNSNKHQIIQLQKKIDIFLLQYITLKSYSIQDLLLNNINNIFLDLFYD